MPPQAERAPRAKQGSPYSPPFLPCLLFARDLSDFVVKASPAAGVFSVGIRKCTANLVKILHMTRYFLRVRAACAFFGAEAGWGENQSANGCLAAASGHDFARCFGVWKTPPRASDPLSASRSYPIPSPARPIPSPAYPMPPPACPMPHISCHLGTMRLILCLSMLDVCHLGTCSHRPVAEMLDCCLLGTYGCRPAPKMLVSCHLGTSGHATTRMPRPEPAARLWRND